jgi:hypothetical protein
MYIALTQPRREGGMGLFMLRGRAEKALAALSAAKAIEDAEAAWTDFLIAAATIYSKLEQGAKGSGRCEGWFGRKKRARKDDQLLRYLHFARNSNEHGIERVVATSASNFHRGRPLGFNERIPVKIHAVDQATMLPIVGESAEGVIAGPTIRPVRAHDRRYNDYCDPPTEHLGRPINFGGNFCYEVGLLGLDYLRGLIQEAEGLEPH